MPDLLERIFAPQASAPGPLADYWYEPVGQPASSGVAVTPDGALMDPTVFACIRVLTETVGMLPLDLFRKLTRGRELALDNEWYDLLHDHPNDEQTSQEWREMMVGHMALRGKAYSKKVYDPLTGRPQALIPLHPDRMKLVRVTDGSLRYDYRNDKGLTETYLPDEIFYLPGFMGGLSVISAARETIGGALAQQQVANRFHASANSPRGALVTDKKLGVDGKQRLKQQWDETQGGVARAFGTAVLEDGLKWQQIGMTWEDAQFLDTRKFPRSELASFFRVPLHMVNDLDRSTNNNIEHQGLEFVIYTMMPWFTRFENRINTELLESEPGQPKVIAKLNVRALLRGDNKSRGDYYRAMVELGIYTRNEVRELEELDPLEGLDEPLTPLNMSQPGQQPPASVIAPQHRAMTESTALRGVRRETSAIARKSVQLAADDTAWRAWVSEFYTEHISHVAEALCIGPGLARLWCEEQKAMVLESGITIIEHWEQQRAPALVRLALGGAA